MRKVVDFGGGDRVPTERWSALETCPTAGDNVMRKMLLMLVAAVSLTVATVAAPSNAQAYCRGCWIGAGVAGAVIAGAAIANAPYYRYGYPAYGYAPYGYGYAPGYVG